MHRPRPVRRGFFPPVSFLRVVANKDRYLYIRRSRIPGAGKGLFTKVDIEKGERVTEYKGKLQRWSEVKDEDGYNAYIFKINSRWAVNALPAVKTLGRYANDARGLSRVEGLRNNSEYDTEGKKVYIVATRKIRKGEEVLVDYGAAFWRLIRKIRGG